MNIPDFELRDNNQSPMPKSSEEKVGIRYDSNFARIEELIKGNTFSRKEITHLMEILNSRVDNEWEKQKTSNAVEDTQMVSWTPEIPRTPSEGKPQDSDRIMIDASHENSDVPVAVGASPIDIARAYMASRNSEGGRDIHNFMLNNERAQPNYEFARKPPLLPAASPKASICWPGAVVHDRHGYTTPQSQRGRNRLHDFPRTPYSRTILSKSTTKLQADSGHVSTSSPFQQSQISIYGQAKSRGETEDAYGSVGPVRHIRNRSASEVRPRGSIFLSSSKATPKLATPQVFGGSLPSAEKKLEPGESSGVSKYMSGDYVSSSSDRGPSDSNISNSQAVRKILEHLDRNNPTPKEKEAELKLATGWRRSSPEATDVGNVENINSMHIEGLASRKHTDTAGMNFPVVSKRSSSKSSFLDNLTDRRKDEANDVVNGNAKAPTSIFTGSKSIIPGASPTPLFGHKGTSGPVVKSLNENASSTTNHGQTDVRSRFSRPPLCNGQDGKALAGTTGLEISKNHGTKHSLPSILINKPELRAVPSGHGQGFTFPVSASSGVNSEPPTPSIMPLSSAGVPPQPIGVPCVPSFTFGTQKTSPGLVFSFPSTSRGSTNDASDLKFSFGSDKTRLSFSSFEKDANCCKPAVI